MKILIVAPRFPFPLDKGDRLTIYHMLQYFSQRHEVSLLCFLEPEQDPAWVEKVEPFCRQVVAIPLNKRRAYQNCLTGALGKTPLQMRYYSDPGMHAAVERMIEEIEPDLLYAHTIRMGQYIEPYTHIPRVLAMQISMTLNYRRLAETAKGLPSKIFHNLEYQKVRAYEGAFARQFDKVLLISPHDLNAIERDRPQDNVFFSPHGVDFEFFAANPQSKRKAHSLIFTGNMGYAPNVDAARFFHEEIFPLVRAEIPEVTWSIVGADPVPEIQAMQADPAIAVTGRVPDLRTYMDEAQVAIDPLRVGAGLQNKVLEGMSMGLPMIITSVANEGIQAEDGKNILIADEADKFARHVVQLLRDADLRAQFGAEARQFIVQNWSWEKHFGDLERMFMECV